MGEEPESAGASRRARLAAALALSWPQRGLLVEAMVSLAVMRVGILVLPFRRLERLARRPAKIRHRPSDTAQGVAWAVRVASRYFPGGTCLTESLATQVLLSRRGLPWTMTLGVRRNVAGRFEAHAWVESAGEIVSGGRQAGEFVSLATFEGLQP